MRTVLQPDCPEAAQRLLVSSLQACEKSSCSLFERNSNVLLEMLASYSARGRIPMSGFSTTLSKSC